MSNSYPILSTHWGLIRETKTPLSNELTEKTKVVIVGEVPAHIRMVEAMEQEIIVLCGVPDERTGKPKLEESAVMVVEQCELNGGNKNV